MRPLYLLFLLLPLFTSGEPIHHWQFDTAHVKDRALTATVGGLNASIGGPFKAETHPESVRFVGTSKAGNEIVLTDDLTKAALPPQHITVEAWVQIDRTQKWGGIVGAIQDNGSYEKGWLLGYNETAFYFALASEGNNRLTYLTSSVQYAAGYWYHVVGTYDGKKQHIYVDGELAASSETQRGPIAYPPKTWFALATYKDNDENYAMGGILESITLWNEVLTDKQIEARFEARKASFPGLDEEPDAQRADTTWPTYLHDNVRNGLTPQELTLPLHPQWIHENHRGPSPAWPPPAQQDFWHNKETLKARVTYDRGFHLVSDGEAVYFGSSAEDFVARINAETGKTDWRYFTEAPVRLAPTLVGERILFGSDDGYVYCLNKQNGDLIYKTRPETAGDRKIPGNERIISVWPVRTGVLVEGKTGFFGSGIFPAQGAYHCSFNIETGAILESQPLDVSPQGYLEQKNGRLFVPTGRVPAGKFLSGLKRRGKATSSQVKSIPADYPYAFIGTPTLRFGGGENKVAALEAKTGKEQWSASVDGKVFSLAIAGNRLFASTDHGKIFCFAHAPKNKPAVVPPPTSEGLSIDSNQVLLAPPVSQGYALLVGVNDSHLYNAALLADQTELRIVLAETNAEKIARAREVLYKQQLAGRVSVHQVADYETLPYTDYLFNLVVSERPDKDLQRVLHPKGIALVNGQSNTRTPLTGIGEWTHLYADPANSTSSTDTHASPDMQLQWFGAPGPQNMVDRHHRSISSLWKDGRVFIPGNERVYGVDAYNGFVQWEAEVPGSRRVGIFRDTGSMAVNSEGLYIASGNECRVLSVEDGKVLRSFTTPVDGEWGYIALVGNQLFGSVVKPGGTRREHSKKQIYEGTYFDNKPLVCSERIFVMDQKTGEVQWEYYPSGAILNPSISIGDGKLYLLESANPDTLEQPTGRHPIPELLNKKGAKIVALELASGSIAWESPQAFPAEVQNLFMLQAVDKLAMVYSRNEKTVRYDVRVFETASGKQNWKASQDNRQKANGDHGEQDHHPLITGGKLIVEPVVYDLASGKTMAHNLRRPGHGCGSMSASANNLFFRAGNPTVYNFVQKSFTKLTKVSRPGCWINMIPAGGLLLIPESSSGCTCNYAVQTSMAFIPTRQAGK